MTVALAPPPQPGRGVLWVPFALTLGLFLLSFVPRVYEHPVLLRSFWSAAAVLLIWQAALWRQLKQASAGRSFRIDLRPQHYVQAMMQLAVFVYWGWHWPPVYDFLWLLVAQLVFAYAFDILLAWSRRDTYVLGFGPFPIIFSTNLFLWFRDDWFYLQFLMVGAGFLGKEFVRWHREGRRVHIFNPSAFSLGLFSLVLIATNTTRLTWGQEIASTLTLAPNIYTFLFLVGLVAMFRFSTTLVSGFAAASLFGASALYASLTGVPYFLDSEVPAAVFLGLHLLVTDPSTSPRTPIGKIVFGAGYGLGVFGLYALLGWLGAPTFYDKLLGVPLLNLLVRRIDHLVAGISRRPVLTAWGLDQIRPRANPAHMAVWIAFFLTMTALGRTDGRQPGDSLPFWQQACAEGRRNACRRLVQLEASYCNDNSGWACNELGRHYREGRLVGADEERALAFFSRACELRLQAACLNLLDARFTLAAAPRILDLRLLLRERGPNLLEMSEQDLYGRACDHRWAFACDRLNGNGV